MKQLSAAAVERAMKLQDSHIAGDGQVGHLVSGGGDLRQQLPVDEALEDAFQVERLAKNRT